MGPSERGSWSRQWRFLIAWGVVGIGGLMISTFTEKPDDFKSVVEGFAVLAAAGYFFQRLLSGYFVVNLSVAVAVERMKEDERDLLAVTATLEKGDRGTLSLHDVVIRVVSEGGTPIVQQVDVQRFAFTRQRVNGTTLDRCVAELTATSMSTPLLNLTPGECMTVSGYVDVPSGKTCLVEVVVLGERTGSGNVAQWRSSTVSLPRDSSAARVPGKPEASSPHGPFQMTGF